MPHPADAVASARLDWWITRGLTVWLALQDHTEEATIHPELAVAAVIDKAQLSELIHKMADP
jgi:hypothetical protein